MAQRCCPYWSILVRWGSSECQSEYFSILKLRSKFFEKPVFGQKVKRLGGIISEGFRSEGRSGCVGGGRISILNVSEDCFCDFCFGGFRSDSGGRFSKILGIRRSVRSQSCPGLVPVLSQSCPGLVPVLSQSCPSLVPVLSQSCPTLVPVSYTHLTLPTKA